MKEWDLPPFPDGPIISEACEGNLKIDRPEELERILRFIKHQKLSAVLCPPKSGLTTFLHSVKEELLNRTGDASLQCCIIDMSEFMNEETFFYDMIKKIGRSLSLTQAAGALQPDLNAEPLDLQNYLTETMEKSRQEIVIIFDDVYKTHENSATLLLNVVRALFNERLQFPPLYRLNFVVGSSGDLMRLTKTRTSPFNIANQIYLSDFSKEQTLHMINNMLQDSSLKTDERFIAALYQQTHGHPYLSCLLVCLAAGEAAASQESVIGSSCVLKAVDSLQTEGDPMFEHIINEIAERSYLKKFLRQMLQRKKVRFSRFNSHMRKLELLGVIKMDDMGWLQFRNPLYERILQENLLSGADTEEDKPEKNQEISTRYRILTERARGGMGIVWKAFDKRLCRIVALKAVAENIVDDENSELLIERLLREARTLAQLDHPNIVTIYDLEKDASRIYLTMEYVDGIDARRYLNDNNKFDPAAAVESIIKICDALHYAHQKGVIHRDIKPENIMMLPDGRIKVTDFGLAKIIRPHLLKNLSGDACDPTPSGFIPGTYSYIAPETLAGSESDAKSDIFSLGCVLFEFLSGEKAFKGASPPLIIDAVLNKEPRHASEFMNKGAEPMADILAGALAKSPEARCDSAAALADKLQQWLITFCP